MVSADSRVVRSLPWDVSRCAISSSAEDALAASTAGWVSGAGLDSFAADLPGARGSLSGAMVTSGRVGKTIAPFYMPIDDPSPPVHGVDETARNGRDGMGRRFTIGAAAVRVRSACRVFTWRPGVENGHHDGSTLTAE